MKFEKYIKQSKGPYDSVQMALCWEAAQFNAKKDRDEEWKEWINKFLRHPCWPKLLEGPE